MLEGRGTISPSKRPTALAAAVRCCEISAKASRAFRDIRYLRATVSAVFSIGHVGVRRVKDDVVVALRQRPFKKGGLAGGDIFLAARGDDVHAFDHYLFNGNGYRHQAGRALSIHGLGSGSDRKPGGKRGMTRDI